MKLNYIVFEKEISINQILKNKFNMSERYILKLKKNKCLFVNGKQAFINHQIKVGDILEIIDNVEEESKNIISNSSINLDILFEDEYLLIINKPPNIPVHPSVLHYEDSLSNGVKYYYEKIGLRKKIRPVNRLDKNTSGIVIFAKNEYIQECLSKQMKEGDFKKIYIAILEGIINDDFGTINIPIGRKENSIIERIVSEEGERAISHFKVLKRFDNMSKVEFALETGRTHQLRVHSKYIGHPIVGDTLYGHSSNVINRQALHAYKVCFIHPITKKEIEIVAEIPEDIKKIC